MHLSLKDAKQPFILKGKLLYAVCSSICISEKMPFNITVPVNHHDSEADTRLASARQLLPRLPHEVAFSINDIKLISQSPTQALLEINAVSPIPMIETDIFIEGDQRLKFLPPTIKQDINIPTQATYQIPIEISDNDVVLKGKTITASFAITPTLAVSTPLTLPNPLPSTLNIPFWLALIFAFIGGLMLNVMPCVLPVLSLKLLGIIKQQNTSLTIIRHNLLMTILGIIASFWVLAVLILAFQFAGQTIGFGFQFQSPYFLISLIVILVIFVCNLWGFFEIDLPYQLQNRLNNLLSEQKNAYVGSFLSGMFATLMATPCSAPFLGTAVSIAFLQSTGVMVSIFTMIGIGMSTPYWLLYFFPQWVSYLPKPGKWMLIVKNSLGLLLLATAIWLLFVLSNQLGNTAAILVFLCCLLLRMVLQLRSSFLKNPWLKLGSIISIILLAFVLPFKLHTLNTARQHQVSSIWQPLQEANIAAYVAKGKIVVVDVSADWCLTCKMNKMLVLNQADILDYLRSPDIIAMRGDLTSPNPTIMAYLKKHNRYAIPFTAIYGPNAPQGLVLPEVLSKQG
ncbi:MAG: protein-disulfide reductase DsbD family protein, partial [Burkholderiales bacterium]